MSRKNKQPDMKSKMQHWLHRLLHICKVNANNKNSSINGSQADITKHTVKSTCKKWLRGIGLQTALKEDAGHNTASAGKLSVCGIPSFSIPESKTAAYKHTVTELIDPDRDGQLMRAQKPTKSKPLICRPRLECAHIQQALRQFFTLGFPSSAKSCGDKKLTGQLEKVADTIHWEKKVRRWLADIKEPFSFPPSVSPNALYFIMSEPAQDARAENIIYMKSMMRCEAWRGQIDDELNSGDKGAIQMTHLLENTHIRKMTIYKKTKGSEHEYLVAELAMAGQRRRTLRFEHQDTDIGADDPPLVNQDVNDDPANRNKCFGTITLLQSIWNCTMRAKMLTGTPAADRVWSDPKISSDVVVVRSIRFRTDPPSLLSLIAALEAVSNYASQYSLARCRHCMWFADSLSAVFETSHNHDILTAAELQGRWRCAKMHVRNQEEVGTMVQEMAHAKANIKVGEEVAGEGPSSDLGIGAIGEVREHMEEEAKTKKGKVREIVEEEREQDETVKHIKKDDDKDCQKVHCRLREKLIRYLEAKDRGRDTQINGLQLEVGALRMQLQKQVGALDMQVGALQSQVDELNKFIVEKLELET